MFRARFISIVISSLLVVSCSSSPVSINAPADTVVIEDEGGSTSIRDLLIAQGWGLLTTGPLLGGVVTDAEYWLLPFAHKVGSPNAPACLFYMTSVRNVKGASPETNVIKSKANVNLELFYDYGVPPKAALALRKPSGHPIVTVNVRDVTPQLFASGKFDLSGCSSSVVS